MKLVWWDFSYCHSKVIPSRSRWTIRVTWALQCRLRRVCLQVCVGWVGCRSRQPVDSSPSAPVCCGSTPALTACQRVSPSDSHRFTASCPASFRTPWCQVHINQPWSRGLRCKSLLVTCTLESQRYPYGYLWPITSRCPGQLVSRNPCDPQLNFQVLGLCEWCCFYTRIRVLPKYKHS